MFVINGQEGRGFIASWAISIFTISIKEDNVILV